MITLNNRDAELAVLGIAMNDDVSAKQVAAMREDLFTSKDTATVFRAIRHLIGNGSGCDLTTVSALLEGNKAVTAEMLVDCCSRGFSPAMLGQYEGILIDRRKRRMMTEMAQKMLVEAHDPSVDLDALTTNVISSLQKADGAAHSMSMHDAVNEYLSWLENISDNLYFSGWPSLDNIVGGFQPGQYIAIGARPAVGKSAFGLSLAVTIAKERGPVLIVSGEMPAMQIAARQVAAESGISTKRQRMEKLDVDAYTAMYAACKEVADLPINVTFGKMTPLRIRREAVRMQCHKGLSAIVIDYIGLLKPDEKSNGRYEAITDISNEIKNLAIELKVPIFVLTQFNRMSEAGQNGRLEKRPPNMSEAKDSGSIEQDADIFMILFDPPPPEMNPGDPCWEAWCTCDRNKWSWLTVIVSKNRDGELGVVHLGFDKPRMQFHDLKQEEWFDHTTQIRA